MYESIPETHIYIFADKDTKNYLNIQTIARKKVLIHLVISIIFCNFVG